ncbi:MAG: serine/threonine protein kinase [Planctomycetota bacterium]|nr:MAG: serine/threonine protein kinase [Planctomycetota bacterium]
MPPKATHKAPGSQRGGNDYPLVGETLGHWRLTEGIGRGGMGEVYAAEYDYLHILTLRYRPEDRPKLRRELEQLSRSELAQLASETFGAPLPPDARFAIKVSSSRPGTAGHRRFLQEASLAKRLGGHPYVVTVHAINNAGDDGNEGMLIDSGKHRDLAFMVMDEATCAYDHTKLSIPQAVHIIRAIATALDHAHKHGVVHRDLKPENFLGTIAHPLLTDFGIAKEVEHTLGLTRTGQVIGTLDYMSPEQATDAKSVDHRSDIYSLGVVLYEFATGGHLPYVHLAEREACLAAIRSSTNAGKWPRDHIPDFPRDLERIILKAIAHDADDRYQSMSELILDLDKYSRGEWISPWGRIGFKRYLHFMRERHPKFVWGVPLTLAALFFIWIASMLPTWLDDDWRTYQQRLDRLDGIVTSIERHGSHQQLSPEQREIYDDMRVHMASSDRRRYRQHQERLEALLERLSRGRYLATDFTHAGSADNDQQQLRWAAGVSDSADWTVSDNGLLFHGNTLLTFRPYGEGLIYTWVTISAREGFTMTITERNDQRHRTVIRIRNEHLEATLQKDETAPRVLFRHPIMHGQTLNLALEVSDRSIRTWLLGQQRQFDIAGLRSDAPAQMILDIPPGTILRQLQIWPIPPSEPEH